MLIEFINTAALRYFTALIGDYESYLMAREIASEDFIPSMKPENIALFIKWKRNPEGTTLRLGDESVLDVFKNPVLCRGDWRDPKQVEGFLSAVTAIHEARGQRETFTDLCEECVAREKLNKKTGCKYHRRIDRLWRRGNPRATDLVENVLRQSTKDGANYRVMGDSPLSPRELRILRKRLISSNSLTDLELWTMIIVSVYLFLRNDDVRNLKFSDLESVNCINWDLTQISEDGFVECIGFTIQGKADKKGIGNNNIIIRVYIYFLINFILKVLSYLFYFQMRKTRIYVLFELSLSWIHISGLKSGYLFPSPHSLLTMVGGVGSQPFDYDVFQRYFVDLCYTLIKRDGIFGSHSLRKTAYLLAVWGGGSDTDIMLAARHSTEKDAAKYKQDASTLLELQRRKGLSQGAISRWQPIRIIKFHLAQIEGEMSIGLGSNRR